MNLIKNLKVRYKGYDYNPIDIHFPYGLDEGTVTFWNKEHNMLMEIDLCNIKFILSEGVEV